MFSARQDLAWILDPIRIKVAPRAKKHNLIKRGDSITVCHRRQMGMTINARSRLQVVTRMHVARWAYIKSMKIATLKTFIPRIHQRSRWRNLKSIILALSIAKINSNNRLKWLRNKRIKRNCQALFLDQHRMIIKWMIREPNLSDSQNRVFLSSDSCLLIQSSIKLLSNLKRKTLETNAFWQAQEWTHRQVCTTRTSYWVIDNR